MGDYYEEQLQDLAETVYEEGEIDTKIVDDLSNEQMDYLIEACRMTISEDWEEKGIIESATEYNEIVNEAVEIYRTITEKLKKEIEEKENITYRENEDDPPIPSPLETLELVQFEKGTILDYIKLQNTHPPSELNEIKVTRIKDDTETRRRITLEKYERNENDDYFKTIDDERKRAIIRDEAIIETDVEFEYARRHEGIYIPFDEIDEDEVDDIMINIRREFISAQKYKRKSYIRRGH
jgi:hypothetical protein